MAVSTINEIIWLPHKYAKSVAGNFHSIAGYSASVAANPESVDTLRAAAKKCITKMQTNHININVKVIRL